MEIEKRIEALQNDLIVYKKTVSSELKHMADAFTRFGEVLDLLYLQLVTTIELLDNKKIINEVEFEEQLKKIASQIETQAKENYEKFIKARKESGSLIASLDDEAKNKDAGGTETKI